MSRRRVHPVTWLAPAAILLRLVLFLGRGDYIAFDEGWYLLLGRNLWSGAGYTLSGLQHVALSPLFPVLAGAVEVILGDAVRAGRVVAAVASGLVVVPCWSIFRCLAGRTAALVASMFVAVMPSLAPFVVPYWIGWDLWVGAEPLLHLFLFAGIALFLRAWQGGRFGDAAGCGAAFALAYLSRPEAVATFGLLGLLAVAMAGRSLRTRSVPVVACALAFTVVAAPYWLYLHDTLGSWTITGRSVQVLPDLPGPAGASEPQPNSIEDMLWRGDASPYIRTLYALNATGTALADPYWGVRSREPVERTSTDPAAGLGARAPTPDGRDDGREGPFDPILRYARAMGVVVPWYVWLLVAPGLVATAGPRRVRLELLVAAPLVATSVLIAVVVATDPRTQLFIAPLACYYAARGALATARGIETRLGAFVRHGFGPKLVVGTVALLLLGTHARRLYLSLAVGSPHHIVAAENAAVGEALREATPEGATVMSWHPAIALFADRDWRVLPLEPMSRIVRYARTQPDPWVVLSVFYPPQILATEEPHYVVVPVPPGTPDGEGWRIEIPGPRTTYAFGRLVPEG